MRRLRNFKFKRGELMVSYRTVGAKHLMKTFSSNEIRYSGDIKSFARPGFPADGEGSVTILVS